jgi:hypothetical protein
MSVQGFSTAHDDWSQLLYKVRVRPTAPAPPQCLWGSAGLLQNITFTKDLILHIRNDLFGEPITFGTQVVGPIPIPPAVSSPPTLSPPIGILQPGECASIPVQACSGVWATCAVESTVYCVIKPSV